MSFSPLPSTSTFAESNQWGHATEHGTGAVKVISTHVFSETVCSLAPPAPGASATSRAPRSARALILQPPRKTLAN